MSQLVRHSTVQSFPPNAVRSSDRSAFSVSGSEGTLQRTDLFLKAVANHQPWGMVLKAMHGANHDYEFNVAMESGTRDPVAAGMYADAMQFLGPLGWDGALSLWQLLQGMTDASHELDLVGAPATTQDLINAIIEKSGTDPKIAWPFFTNLDRIGREQGLTMYYRPTVEAQSKALPDNVTPWLIGGAVLLAVIAFHEVRSAL